jgi:DNA-binding transcriptional LysR family regulator
MSDNAQIDWEDLRHFLALAEGGSLSEAARRLNVDHTTVARRLASLEKTLDLRLVDRLPRAVLLTPEGRRIAEAGKGIEDTIFAVARAAAGAGSSLAGPVRISAPPAFATAVLAPRIAAWRTRFPAIAITLLGEVGAADLGHRQADISLRLSRPDKESPDLVARKVGELSFAFYAAQGYDMPEPDWAFIA